MKNSSKKRLLKLARHLGNTYLKDLITRKNTCFNSSKGNCNIDCFYWVIKELPKVFHEWRYDDQLNPYLVGKREMNSFTAACYFLDLDIDSMFHLFVSGYQMPEMYYGKPLPQDAKPSQVSSNIYEYLRHLDDVEAGWEKFDETVRTILLTPIKNKSNETNKNKLSKVCA